MTLEREISSPWASNVVSSREQDIRVVSRHLGIGRALQKWIDARAQTTALSVGGLNWWPTRSASAPKDDLDGYDRIIIALEAPLVPEQPLRRFFQMQVRTFRRTLELLEEDGALVLGRALLLICVTVRGDDRHRAAGFEPMSVLLDQVAQVFSSRLPEPLGVHDLEEVLPQG